MPPDVNDVHIVPSLPDPENADEVVCGDFVLICKSLRTTYDYVV